jgi:hypothetical protein
VSQRAVRLDPGYDAYQLSIRAGPAGFEPAT